MLSVVRRIWLGLFAAWLGGCVTPYSQRDAGGEAGEDAPPDPCGGCPPGWTCTGIACVAAARDAGTDAARDASRDAADVPGTVDARASCCPMATPSCGCVQVGGARLPDGTCRRVCDVWPMGWVRSADAQGCAEWIVPEISCASRDAGGDATSDVVPAADASAGLDAATGDAR